MDLNLPIEEAVENIGPHVFRSIIFNDLSNIEESAQFVIVEDDAKFQEQLAKLMEIKKKISKETEEGAVISLLLVTMLVPLEFKAFYSDDLFFPKTKALLEEHLLIAGIKNMIDESEVKEKFLKACEELNLAAVLEDY